MGIPQGIHDNLRFLIAEIASQVGRLHDDFDDAQASLPQLVIDRAGYASNLKRRIQEGCQHYLANDRNRVDAAAVRAAEIVAVELDRIAELCRDSVQQLGYLRSRELLRTGSYRRQLKLVGKAVVMVEGALDSDETQIALRIGRVEPTLDREYRKLLKRYGEDIARETEGGDLIAALLVAHRIEEMGDALLRISEALLSASIGQQIRTDHYHALVESVDQLGSRRGTSNLKVETIAETRSGGGVSGVSSDDGDYVAVFKEGRKKKLKDEREGVESWHEIYPGLAPRILSYNKSGKSASLLIEYLAGQTFEQILLHESPEMLGQALQALNTTLNSIWTQTRSKGKVPADYMAQLEKRLDGIYSVHPEFQQGDKRICGTEIVGFETLLRRAAEYEQQLSAPFSVYIHGDFNVDNVIYDPIEKHINFIDLHRSCYSDYVQDISVFMVSNYRLQVMDPLMRRRISLIAQRFHDVACRHASTAGDDSFELRLALGLARSFATSTRFILDKSLARAMFLRSRYLLERILETDPKRASKFRTPVQEIFVG
jgi:aminoglycoside phosphotransferase